MRPQKTRPSQPKNSFAATDQVPRERDWIERETAASCFADLRLAQRFGRLLSQMSEHIGATVPMACQDWANTKAAYRFFDNERVSEAEILAGHFASTRERAAEFKGPVLVLHDTTEFSFQREKEIGLLGKLRQRIMCGLLLHSSLAVSSEGLPLGLAAVKFWTRQKFKGCNALKRKINPTRVPIDQKESQRWLDNLREASTRLTPSERLVHIADREGDIYELFCAAEEAQTNFLIRTCVDRLAEDGQRTVEAQMQKTPVQGVHRLLLRSKNGESCAVELEIKYRHLWILPPIGKQQKYPDLPLTVIHAIERGTPKDRKKVEWKLVTNLPVESLAEAIEKLEWYAMRWKIETFHKILKSGCRVEESKLRTAERLVNRIAICCVLSWRIFWMTMVQRSAPKTSPLLALTEVELLLLDEITAANGGPSSTKRTLADYLLCIARLGGYLARAHDPPPGNIVMWRGLSRLTDIQLGFAIGARFMGN